METRKIQLVGNRSYSVSLPKQWVISNKLKEQDNVFVELTDKNEVLIKSDNDPLKERSEITADLAKIDNISEFLVFCYVKNIDNVTLFSRKFEYDKVAAVKKVLQYLEGYDITSEDEKRIEISFLFHDVNINLRQILRRTMYLLSLMMAALRNKDMKTLEDTETSIDRLYHLSKRIIFRCLRNSELRKENSIRNEDDLFFASIIAKKLENVGDILYSLQYKDHTDNDLEIISEFLDILSKVTRNVSVNTLIDETEALRDKRIRKRSRELLVEFYNLCRDVLENMLSIKYNEEYF